MDPYQTLGVPRDCTREEAREAFRAKALLAHPDRGGEPAAFIQLRQAYDQIMATIQRRPPVPAAESPARPSGHNRRPSQPDPNWEPDLIVIDEPLPRVRPPRPPGPDWQPELIISDEEPHQGRAANSRDPRPARPNYATWLRRQSARLPNEEPGSRGSDWSLGAVMALLVVVILTVWICWTAWSYDNATSPAGVATKYDPLRDPE